MCILVDCPCLIHLKFMNHVVKMSKFVTVRGCYKIEDNFVTFMW